MRQTPGVGAKPPGIDGKSQFLMGKTGKIHYKWYRWPIEIDGLPINVQSWLPVTRTQIPNPQSFSYATSFQSYDRNMGNLMPWILHRLTLHLHVQAQFLITSNGRMGDSSCHKRHLTVFQQWTLIQYKVVPQFVSFLLVEQETHMEGRFLGSRPTRCKVYVPIYNYCELTHLQWVGWTT